MNTEKKSPAPQGEKGGNGKSSTGKGSSQKGFFSGAGKKMRDRVEDEATEEALSAYCQSG